MNSYPSGNIEVSLKNQCVSNLKSIVNARNPLPLVHVLDCTRKYIEVIKLTNVLVSKILPTTHV